MNVAKQRRNRVSYRRQKSRVRIVGFIVAVILITILLLMKVSVVAAHAETSSRYKYYTSVYVDRDVTLWDISKEYVTDDYKDIRSYMEEVKAINHLTSDQLSYGTTLTVPYYSEYWK